MSLPIRGVLLVVVIGLGIGVLAHRFQAHQSYVKSLQESPAYQKAMAQVRGDETVRQMLGRPIEPGWKITGSITEEATAQTADLQIPLKGPLGNGTLLVNGKSDGSDWILSKLSLVDQAGETMTDLLYTQSSHNVTDSMNVSWNLVHNEQYAEAVVELTAILQANPSNVNASYLRGHAYFHLNEFELAEEDLTRTRRSPDFPYDGLVYLGRIYHQQRQTEECIDAFSEALRRNVEDGEAWYYRALCFQQQGKIREASGGAGEACVLGVAQACNLQARLGD